MYKNESDWWHKKLQKVSNWLKLHINSENIPCKMWRREWNHVDNTLFAHGFQVYVIVVYEHDLTIYWWIIHLLFQKVAILQFIQLGESIKITISLRNNIIWKQRASSIWLSRDIHLKSIDFLVKLMRPRRFTSAESWP